MNSKNALYHFGIFTIAACLSAVGSPGARANQITVYCNNTSSDAAKINKAIAGSKHGDEIVINGPALLTSGVTLLGGRSYRGNSPNTVLKQADKANLPYMLASDSYVKNWSYVGEPIEVCHLHLDGNSAENAGSTAGIVLRAWRSDIHDIVISDMGGDGFRITNLSANATALTTTCVNGHFASLNISNCGGNGFWVQDTGNAVTDCQLLDSWISGVGNDAIKLDNAAGWMVERNHAYTVAKNAIEANRLYFSTICDNYIEDFGTTTVAGSYYGIYGSVQGGAASTIFHNRISCNSGEREAKSSYAYIGLKANYGSALVTLTGNAIYGAGTSRGTGFAFDLGGGSSFTVTSTGNGVTNVGTQRTIGSGVTVDAGI